MESRVCMKNIVPQEPSTGESLRSEIAKGKDVTLRCYQPKPPPLSGSAPHRHKPTYSNNLQHRQKLEQFLHLFIDDGFGRQGDYGLTHTLPREIPHDVSIRPATDPKAFARSLSGHFFSHSPELRAIQWPHHANSSSGTTRSHLRGRGLGPLDTPRFCQKVPDR